MASGRDVTGKGGVRQQLIDAWNREQQRKNTGFHARLVELPGSADEQRSQLLGALQSGSARYDVVNLDVTWVPEFAEAGLISPLRSTLVDRDVIPSVAVTARWHDTVYAVPFNSDVGLLFYRRDHLREAGVQQTDLAHGRPGSSCAASATPWRPTRPRGSTGRGRHSWTRTRAGPSTPSRRSRPPPTASGWSTTPGTSPPRNDNSRTA